MKKIVIIDGNSLINRAYYAMQRPMVTKEGIFTQGIYGFLNMLNKILSDYEPEYITVAFDKKAPTFRHKAYEEYKAGRKSMPPELAMQLPILKDILHIMKIKTLELEGFEADDIIGTVAGFFEENSIQPLIITGDKDALQLCSDVTKVIFTKKGISEFDVYDEQKMREVYSLTPTQFIDLKGLMGDKSDNIPGIPGVGEKTGIKLLEQFGSVEKLISDYEEIKNDKLRQKVEDNIDLMILSKKLATINTNVPIEIELNDFLLEEPDNEKLAEMYKKLEFNSFLKKMNFTCDNVKLVKRNYNEIKIQDNIDELDKLKNKTCYIKIFSNNSHIDLPEINLMAILDGDNLYYITERSEEENRILMKKIDSLNLKLKGHSVKSDIYDMMAYGLDNIEVEYDTEIAAYLLQPNKASYIFNELVSQNLMIDIPAEDEILKSESQISLFEKDYTDYVEYLKKYFEALENLELQLNEAIKSENLQEILNTIELPLIKVLASMEINGMDVDVNVLDEIGKLLEDEILKLENSIYLIAGEEFKINSPKQLGHILFEKLGLPAGKKNKNGYSTSADVLEKLKDKSPLVELVLKYRTVSKLNSTYIAGIKPLLTKSNRIHAHFQQTVTATGRISCTEPNLQNIPVRDDLGRNLRKAYIAKDGYCLVGADYSQIELRVLAHLSQDDELMEAFLHDKDIHSMTASKVLGIPLEDVTGDDRRRAKAVNFGVIYGMSSFGLSEELNISRKEAQNYIDDYFKKYDKVKQFMDEQIELSKDRGYSLTALGRKRYINELKSSNYMVRQFGERLAMNTPIQGTAADIIKIAMVKVYDELKRSALDARLVLQVHDELILRVRNEDKDKTEELLQNAMQTAFDMCVPLKSEPTNGGSWYDLK